jgi:hypothetical protein
LGTAYALLLNSNFLLIRNQLLFMNICVRRLALVGLWVFFSAFLSAQVGFSLPFINDATPGTTKSLNVTTTNFDSVVGVQFVLRWDPTVLKYIGIDNLNLPDLDPSDFNASQAVDSGIVRLLWIWSNPQAFPGVSLPDGTSLFRLRLNVIGQDSSSSSVVFTQSATTVFDVTKVAADSMLYSCFLDDVVLSPGFVAVGYTVAANEPFSANNWAIRAFPNPFSELTNIQFSLDESADIQAIVTDLAGKIVFENTLPNLPPGQHGMEIEKAFLRKKGAYFLTLRSGAKVCVQPLFLF